MAYIIIYKRYFPWTNSEEFLAQDEYCLFDELCSFLNDLLLMNFKIKSSRKMALEMYRSIKRDKIVSKCKRFPDDGVYFNITSTLFGSIFEKIVGCLRCQEEGLDEPVFKCKCEEIFNYELERLLYEIEECPIDKRHKKGIFTQRTFENFFELEWQKGCCICLEEENGQVENIE